MSSPTTEQYMAFGEDDDRVPNWLRFLYDTDPQFITVANAQMHSQLIGIIYAGSTAQDWLRFLYELDPEFQDFAKAKMYDQLEGTIERSNKRVCAQRKDKAS